jgi:tetratricopeptide (TPR) repeat protein
MKVSDFTSLLLQPQNLDSPLQTQQLEEVLESYPWFQPARALYLKGLHNLNSYKYNQALKYAAACTTDREVLFDYITSEEFLQDSIAETLEGGESLEQQEIVSEAVEPNPERDTGMIEKEPDSPLPRSAKEADRILDPKLFRSLDPNVDKSLEEAREKARQALDMGSPLTFTKKERYSFSEWLQITSFKKDGAGDAEQSIENSETTPADPDTARKEKFARIDRFIEKNPKILPVKGEEVVGVNIKSSVKLDKEELMTETLARVYLEQGKYKKAIQAYRILSLKYPEKSGFFADRIKAVKKLRDDKSK